MSDALPGWVYGRVKSVVAATGIAALIAAPLITPLWWIIGAIYFGLAIPEYSLARWLVYTAWLLLPAALLFAAVLRKRFVSVSLCIEYWKAFVIAFVSLTFVHAGIGVVTLYQYGYDYFVFLASLALGFASAILFALFLSRSTPPLSE